MSPSTFGSGDPNNFSHTLHFPHTNTGKQALFSSFLHCRPNASCFLLSTLCFAHFFLAHNHSLNRPLHLCLLSDPVPPARSSPRTSIMNIKNLLPLAFCSRCVSPSLSHHLLCFIFSHIPSYFLSFFCIFFSCSCFLLYYPFPKGVPFFFLFLTFSFFSIICTHLSLISSLILRSGLPSISSLNPESSQMVFSSIREHVLCSLKTS